MWLRQRKTQKLPAEEKQTHGLFSIHGLHPQFPLPLRESLESDGHISTETVTDSWMIQPRCSPPSPSSVPLVSTFTHKKKENTTWEAKQKRILTQAQEQSLRASLKYLIKSHLWEKLVWQNDDDIQLLQSDCWEMQQNLKQTSAAQRQMNHLFTDTCVMRLKLSAKRAN